MRMMEEVSVSSVMSLDSEVKSLRSYILGIRDVTSKEGGKDGDIGMARE